MKTDLLNVTWKSITHSSECMILDLVKQEYRYMVNKHWMKAMVSDLDAKSITIGWVRKVIYDQNAGFLTEEERDVHESIMRSAGFIEDWRTYEHQPA